MLGLKIVPEIFTFNSFQEFNQCFNLQKEDLILTNEWLYHLYIEPLHVGAKVIFQEKYGKGEPTDKMIDGIIEELQDVSFNRIIAIGGGTILDIGKVLSLDIPNRTEELFMGNTEIRKKYELIAVPTTCGTGSEVTNVAIAELSRLQIKKGIACDETFADKAVMIPELLHSIPEYVFATSSIDALIHAVESYLSPKASPYTDIFAEKAIRMILGGYKEILECTGNVEEIKKKLLPDFCFAANYAGISFSNAGCGAVHALSYSIGGAYHVPHGEANYQFFGEILKCYQCKNPEGKIKDLNRIFSEVLACFDESLYDQLEQMLNRFAKKKKLREYGMKEIEIQLFTEKTIVNQQRLLSNNYVHLSEEEIRGIFERLY